MSASQNETLCKLHSDIDSRVLAIREGREWLCGKGCDGCCRRLAQVPRLTAAEWDLLQGGLVALPAARLQEIRLAVAQLADQTEGSVVCPLLEQSSGACPVYAQRPVACRTYGFYVQRDLGLYCAEIESQVAAGTWADVVWGNQDAVDQRLAALGETLSLCEWFERDGGKW